MTHLIIHTNKEVLEQEVVKLINSYLDTGFKSLEEIQGVPDFHIVIPEEDKNSISIEQCKQLQKDLIYSPFQHKYQFGIILDAQIMTTQAQNSLLKTFEETKECTIIILTVNNEKSVLETILSRCSRIYPKNNTLQEIDKGFLFERAFLEKNIYEQITQVEEIVKNQEIDSFLHGMTRFFQKEYAKKIENGEDYQKEIHALELLRDVRFKINRNVNSKIALEYLIFKISDI